ncbi:diacylglycerol kinase catalytic region [Catenulispora acidiphila DSM 44928]|uniref:Diacylglycerol kinase catalytic region n=1 Tax=Catenulispora acidiphila (strain DSM 44928 / JCM 14897 / NBRC 102108 / NRRL B-24433 / ID139908) TaxID=479433 RepID=C7Q975_CATAD|nr:diacylglycerol kinase family protein [Catenulispora acidiphila]ACU72395.1 diacylglycerol kinase catalytic region [Catenulispora acidiphila DSM 44928]
MAVDRWARALARIGVACLVAAVVVLLVAIVFFHGLSLVLGVLAALLLTGVGLWWLVTRRGVLRWVGAALAGAAPVVLIVLAAVAGFWIDGVVVAALVAAGVGCAHSAVRRLEQPQTVTRSRTRHPARPRKPVLIMNPKSGDGKVGEFGLVEKAESLGARVLLLDPDADQDVAKMAREAVADGADLLGVAGGDGTQALVAAVAAEHDLPFLVLSAGTRNHFALDLGLDRDDPAAGLDALRDGIELRVDLGTVADRPFVNTASFGAYAEIVQNPQYRDSKAGTALEHLPDLLTSDGAALTVEADGEQLPSPQVLLVSNNPYLESGRLGGGRRPRLDRGVLGVVAVHVEGALSAAGLAVLGTGSDAVTVTSARQVRVDGAEARIPVAVDGEALNLDAPVICTIQPGALRVRVPRKRPAQPPPRSLKTECRTVLGLALGHLSTSISAEPDGSAEQRRGAGPDQNAEPNRSTESDRNLGPHQSTKPHQSPEPDQNTEPNRSAEPHRSAEPDQSTEPHQGAQPDHHAPPNQSAESPEGAEPNRSPDQ